jgi:uncharacterized protein YdhG (YjbR/CyaY superfamily)
MRKAADVDAYIESAPREVRGKLREIRAAIKDVAPNAEERISYGMPYYDYKGRLIYFGLAKSHIGLYIPSPILEEHKEELSNYETTNATLRLPLDKELPIDLIKKLVKARMQKNEAARS